MPGLAAAAARPDVAAARRVVIKVGSSSLTSPDGHLDGDRVDRVVDVLAAERSAGRTVVLVSSGAIAAGFGPLGMTGRPRDLATLQAAASVGQGLLMHRYTESFRRHDLIAAQVLLTADDVVRRAHYLNACRALGRLLTLGVIPVVNENDAVATQEIRFGDNDRLAALVALVVEADLLVLLSDVDGVYDADPRQGGAHRLHEVRDAAALDGVVLGRTGAAVSTGGMATKVDAARIATGSGVHVVVGAASDAAAILAGEGAGTHFLPTGARSRSRLLWLAHASAPRGRLVLDDGAVAAVVERHTSLLPAGIVRVEGDFVAGDPVELVDPLGKPVARGLTTYSAEELPGVIGRSTRDLAAELGAEYEREVVHRDDLVLL
ncbi:MAG TPA: glutamate 5-kinase [Mycobacteriales bacterium]|nr:glutamate 5-kinase [Mycobacteriales bacterium]